MRKGPGISRADSSDAAFESLPPERILTEPLENARLVRSIRIVNGRHPERINAALEGEHVGTIVHAGHRARA